MRKPTAIERSLATQPWLVPVPKPQTGFVYMRFRTGGLYQFAFRKQDGTWAKTQKPEFAKIFSGVKFPDAKAVAAEFPEGTGRRDWKFINVKDFTW